MVLMASFLTPDPTMLTWLASNSWVRAILLLQSPRNMVGTLCPAQRTFLRNHMILKLLWKYLEV